MIKFFRNSLNQKKVHKQSEQRLIEKCQTLEKELALKYREYEIEEALERIRSRAMAMQKSEDLSEVLSVSLDELKMTGFVPNEFKIGFIDKHTNEITLWGSGAKEARLINPYRIKPWDHPFLHGLIEDFKKGTSYRTVELSGQSMIDYLDVLFSETEFKNSSEEYKKARYAAIKVHISHAMMNHGFLEAGGPQPLDEEKADILQRFSKVVDLTYTRFMDITKAEEQSETLHREREKLELTLKELRATQSKLVQSEKMASLGELTAGIAHEIQNPLNFVNNFSEVSKELLVEMKEELANGSKEEAEAIADDLIQNLDKINHHGKRAASIVKGMLQHSRSSSGHNELTDINSLADEYLRLSFHGLRAKDKSFQAEFKMDLDPRLPRIKVNSQDIGRVLLNLINNAFYAVSSKALTTKENGYKPEVIVTTSRHLNAITVSIKDNGGGILPEIKDKIFQPFFTTKPPGEGTGLGLSLSFEIIKAHGGEILLDTDAALGTTFTVSLPINEM